MKSGNINWNKNIFPIVTEQLEILESKGIYPTVRGMYYRLFSLGILEGLKNPYKSLDAFLSRVRWGSIYDHKYSLPMDAFADDTRIVIKNWNGYKKPQDTVNSLIDYISDFPEGYRNNIPRWLDQPHYVEVWVEKKAMVGTLQNILEGKQVRIVPTSGYSSLPFIHDNMTRLEQNISAGKVVHILYLGDFDPSGVNIESVLKAGLVEYRIYEDVDWQRIGVREEQLERYRLPVSVDAQTEEKLRRDPRAKAWLSKYGGLGLTQVEIDSLPTIVPEEFKRIVLEPIDRWFQKDVYDKVMARKEHTERELMKMLRTGINKVYKDINAKKK